MVTGWFEVAGRLTEAEGAGPRDEKGRTWLSILSAETKNNQNMLRRMQRARDFVESNFQGEEAEKLSRMPMSYIDILSRAHYLDKDASLQLAKELIDDEKVFTYRSLLDRYDIIKDNDENVLNAKIPHKSGVFYFKKRCFEIARDGGMDKIFHEVIQHRGDLKFRIWKGGHAFVSPHMTCRLDAAEVSNQGYLSDIYRIDAFDCYTQYADESGDVTRDRVLKALSEASFFTRLWIMLPVGGDARYEGLLERLGPTNLGIVRVDLESGSCRCTLTPKQAPMPDRRNMWSDHERRYTA